MLLTSQGLFNIALTSYVDRIVTSLIKRNPRRLLSTASIGA